MSNSLDPLTLSSINNIYSGVIRLIAPPLELMHFLVKNAWIIVMGMLSYLDPG